MADIDVACVGDACPRFDGGRVAAAALLPTSGGGGRGTGVSTPEPARQYTWKAGAQLPLAPLAGMARRAIARRSARRRGGTVKAAASPGEDGALLAVAFSRQLLLPQALGLQHSGRWRWRLAPCALHLGADATLLPRAHARAVRQGERTLEIQPTCRVRLAKRALGCSLTFHMLPRPALELSRPLLRQPPAPARRRAGPLGAGDIVRGARRLASRIAIRAVLSPPDDDRTYARVRVQHPAGNGTDKGRLHDIGSRAARALLPAGGMAVAAGPRLRFHVEWRSPEDNIRLGRALTADTLQRMGGHGNDRAPHSGASAATRTRVAKDGVLNGNHVSNGGGHKIEAQRAYSEIGGNAGQETGALWAGALLSLAAEVLRPVGMALSSARALGADSIALAEARGITPFVNADSRVNQGQAPRRYSVSDLTRRVLPSALHFDFIRFGKTFEGGSHDHEGVVPAPGVDDATSAAPLSHDLIAVVAGHWIDPWDEPGAPGEREFNLEVADRVERLLKVDGWRVLRPERDAPSLRWEDYLQWAGAQSRRGVPVLEIHGQGAMEDGRFLQGVLGTRRSPLNAELAEEFGFFPMDWRELALPRKGGVILEAFNSDEVLAMGPTERATHADAVATKVVLAIERASMDDSCQTSFCETAADPTPEERILRRGW